MDQISGTLRQRISARAQLIAETEGRALDDAPEERAPASWPLSGQRMPCAIRSVLHEFRAALWIDAHRGWLPRTVCTLRYEVALCVCGNRHGTITWKPGGGGDAGGAFGT